jgi:cell division protein FtsB
MTLRGRAQGALAALALVAILFVFVFPTRSYLAQRRDVRSAQRDVDVLHQENDKLQQEAIRLHQSAEIERQARQHFHWHYPGEEVFNVLPAPAPGAGNSTTTVP